MSLADGPSAFIAALQPASFRSVPFGVLTETDVFGRRVALHEYPMRDKPWAEDLGRASRRLQITGFLVTDSLVYGGGDVIAQRDAMVAALETEGAGTLVHPTLGSLQVQVEACGVTSRWDEGRYFELAFSFIESGDHVFPTSTASTQDAVLDSADSADAGAAADFTTALTPQLALGAITGQTAIAALGPWSDALGAFGQDATSLFNLAAELPGQFGRFFNAANLSAFSPLSQLVSPATTLADLVAAASSARTTIAAATGTMDAVAANLGLGASNASPDDFAAAAQAAVGAALASAANPADAIRLLRALTVTPPVAASATATGQALGDLFRRAAVVALARAGTTYQPSSYQDANAVRGQIADALDAEIDIAGDEAADATFNALRALRVAVVQDLTLRGATLAPITAITLPMPLPALVVAQQLYRDPTRADQLVGEAQPVSPLFMPTAFQALSV